MGDSPSLLWLTALNALFLCAFFCYKRNVKNEKESAFRAGFVAMIGPTNVGKSTLLNRVMGGHFAIVTEKPQTTRTIIRTIKTLDNAQLIFIDTPGLHLSQKSFNKLLIQSAKNACKEADVALALFTAQKSREEENESLISYLRHVGNIPKVIAINKIDRAQEQWVAALRDRLAKEFPSSPVLPISALLGTGVEDLIQALIDRLPASPPLFPEDLETDMTERFFAAEIIREKIYTLTKDELPYEIAVEIESFKEDEEKNILRISAVIHVNRESQKRIIIGKNGTLIKEIGSRARVDLENFFQIHVYLELWVRVSRNWMKNPRMLKELGIIN